MRILAAFGALLFGYLVLIPAGLVGSTLDSACAGPGCESSLALRIAFTTIYALCLVALGGATVLLADYALRGTAAAERRVQQGFKATAFVIAGSAFALLAFAFPAAGASGIVLAAALYLGIKRLGRPDSQPDPRMNGHSQNGHRAL